MSHLLVAEEEVVRLATLNSLCLPSHEVPGIVQQLNDVLGYAMRVTRAARDLPEAKIRLVNVLRSDEAIQSNSDEILAGAPSVQERYFVVPAVFEGK